eukprot:XP_011436606.2 PREDICTED: latrophilin Cirl [Crassostrea gigas]
MSRIRLLIMVILSSSTTNSVMINIDVTCPPNWTQHSSYKNICYRVGTTAGNFTSATAGCEAFLNGSTVANVYNLEIHNFLADGLLSVGHEYYTGLTDVNGEYVFTQLDSEPLGPWDRWGSVTGGTCTVYANEGGVWVWHTNTCDQLCHYICEYIVPTPGKDEFSVLHSPSNGSMLSIAETGSNILSEKQSSSWKELPENNKTQVAASFLVSMETTGFNIADNLEEADSIVSSHENLLMEVSAVNVTRDKPAVTYPSYENQKWKDDQITIPMEDIEALSEGGITKVVVFVYLNMDELMTTKRNTSFINSNILSTSIKSANSGSLRKAVTFTLRLFQVFSESVMPTCAYWDFRESGWSRVGCWRLSFNLLHATCQCSHLGHFAVLMENLSK